ncbi:MAG: 2-iminobutanoate/2-iminopropanoate deaminase [Candidatus Binatia bacterium]|jgi:2-iminobutanoate/2-iminopropanoate deaminase
MSVVIENKTEQRTNEAPKIPSESQAVRCGNLLYVSAQTGRDPSTGEFADDLDGQTHQMLANLDAVLAGAGLSKADLVMVTLVFSYIKLFKRVDEIYADWIPPREEIPLPGVTAFASDHLPDGALLQIECVAAYPEQ